MNRTTKLLAAALVGGAALVASAGPAGAVGETIGACLLEEFEVTEMAIELAEGASPEEVADSDKFAEVVEKHPEYLDHAIDVAADADDDVETIEEEAEDRYEDCLDAPNPLLPEKNEIIWGAVGFVVVFGFLAKFGLPAARSAMAARTEKIAAELQAAEDAKAEAEAEKARYSASLADAKSEAARIIEEARQQADSLKSEAQTRLNEELAQARTAAQADIDAAKAAAMSELRGEVATIAIGAAEAVVGQSLDTAAQTRLVEDYISNIRNGN